MMLPDSPTVDALRVAAAMRRRFPVKFHAYIEMALWESLGDYLRGHRRQQSTRWPPAHPGQPQPDLVHHADA